MNIQLDDLYNGFEDGINLVRLLEVLSASSLGRVDARPKIRIQKIQNVNKALTYISSTGVRLENIMAEGALCYPYILSLLFSLLFSFPFFFFVGAFPTTDPLVVFSCKYYNR